MMRLQHTPELEVIFRGLPKGLLKKTLLFVHKVNVIKNRKSAHLFSFSLHVPLDKIDDQLSNEDIEQILRVLRKVNTGRFNNDPSAAGIATPVLPTLSINNSGDEPYIDGLAWIPTYKIEETLSEMFPIEIERPSASISLVDFNPETGKGIANGREFSLIRGKTPYSLFSACFAQIGMAVEREKVLKLIGLYKDGDVKATRTTHVRETEAINKAVVRVRSSTGLSKQQFVQSGGNITLYAKALSISE